MLMSAEASKTAAQCEPIARPGSSVHAAPKLKDHHLGVTDRARKSADVLGDAKFTTLAYLAGLWHDLGKENLAWQAYIQGLCGLSPDQQRQIQNRV
jgi:HD superfamily phosphohydrolase YqeK